MKNQHTYKTASLLTIASILFVVIIGPAVFVYIVDPFQIYHKSIFKSAKYSTNHLYQNAGWINTLLADPQNNYQGIVIGSSTIANYSQAIINKHLSWGNTMNLVVYGSTPKIQHATAKYALEKNQNIKHILWDVHFYYVFDPDPTPGKDAGDGLHFPYYLYNNNPFDDGAYLFNASNVKTGLNFMAGDFSEFNMSLEDDGFYANLVTRDRFNSYNSQENRRKILLPLIVDANRQLPGKPFYEKRKFLSIDQYMLDLLLPLCNHDIEIDILFSPTTRHNYAATADIDNLYNQIYMRRYIVEKTGNCKNIKVFAFDNVDQIVNNLGNYADSFHYKTSVNDYILDSIANDENQLTMQNIDQYETVFIHNINAYKTFFLSEL